MTKKKGWVTPHEALKSLAKNDIHTTYPTLIAWVREYELGSKPKGRWFISEIKLKKFIKQNFYTEMKTVLKKKKK